MSEARQTLAWNQTAEILAAIFNNNPYRSKSYVAEQFNPFARNGPPQPQKIPKISDEAAMRIFETCWGLKREPKPQAKPE